MALTDPLMGLRIWNHLTDLYDHTQQADNLTKIAAHDHSFNKGVQIPTGGIADGAITAAKIAPGAVIVPTNGVATATIQNNAVTAAKIGDIFTAVTSMPSSPFDGQIVTYVADATNGLVWTFRYRTASASTYKWEAIGGPWMRAEVATTQTAPANTLTYIDLTTVGPSITLPLSGDYEYRFLVTGYLGSGVGNANPAVGLSINNGAPGATDVAQGNGTGGMADSLAQSGVIVNRTATDTAKLKYWDATNYTYRTRKLFVRPIRVI